MAAKLFTIVLALLCAFQLSEAARLVPRSADTTSEPSTDVLANAGETITRTLDSWKEGIQDLLKGAPSVDSVLDNISTSLKTVSGKVESAAKDIVDSLSTATTVKP